MKYIPNALSSSRIILACSLLLITPLSFLFMVIYTIAGITDMIDGPIARRYKVTSVLGANLDGIADYAFVTIAIIRLVPAIAFEPILVAVVLAGLVVLKGLGMVIGYVRYNQLMMMHTYASKTGAILAFLFPLVLVGFGIEPNTLLIFLGIYVYLFLLEEIAINLILPEPDRNITGIYEAMRRKYAENE
ncbi:MAG: CDP-alcohol phosphatidyltransferase family protein [Defluviitaleaceae bacterium]|nr:CDP-alcohol phosphatidyltransferase family protein [Defluviitaleaceae bacterium]